jgi:hypothetical protein
MAEVGLELHPGKTTIVYCKECVTNAKEVPGRRYLTKRCCVRDEGAGPSASACGGRR